MSIILIRERKESVEREGRRGGRIETLCEEPCEKAMGEVRLLFTGKGGPLGNIPGHSGLFNRTIATCSLGL